MSSQAKTIRARRKAGGVFYTPEHIVDFVIHQTLGPLLHSHSDLKIIDPSCGAGAFLVAAYEYLLNWHRKQRGELSVDDRKAILLRSIYGVDVDPAAVEAARQSLITVMLRGHHNESAEDAACLDLSKNIVCGDAIIARKKDVTNWRHLFAVSGFNAVIGNPPYGAKLTASEKKCILENYHCGLSDTAAAFVERGISSLAAKGRLGFVIPKAFLYASNWAKLRERHLQRIETIVDLGKGWRDVKLEQCAVILANSNSDSAYRCFIRRENEFNDLGAIRKTVASEFEFLLHGVSADEIALAQRLRNACESLAGRCVNQRGAMLQKAVRKKGDVVVLGGRHIQRWLVRPKTAQRIDAKLAKDDKARVFENAVLVQNIVAHVEHPVDHIKITAALAPKDTKQFRLLDTINQLRCKSELDAELVCALLNSKLLNWYAYRFVFGKAVRTMHFDATATDKLPIPKHVSAKQAKQVSDLAKQLSGSGDSSLACRPLETELNALINKLYGLSAEECAMIERAVPG